MSEAGEIASLTGLTQGIGLDVRPFAGARWLHTEATGTTDFSDKPGFDLFYNFTPSLKLSATVNTDFGETEVDARQINLSRFSILFPEKRAFFLEDAGVFNFASIGTINPPPGGIVGRRRGLSVLQPDDWPAERRGGAASTSARSSRARLEHSMSACSMCEQARSAL